MRKLLLFIIISLLSIQSAMAALDLELTKGVNRAIPLALVPFAATGSAQTAANKILQVVQRDLTNSGRFRIYAGNSLTRFPNQASQVDLTYWQKQKINNLLVGKIQSIGDGRYQLRVQLMDVFAAKGYVPSKATSAPVWQKTVLVNHTYTTNNQGLRRLAHAISDAIYQKLTGVRGIFSTRIAYVQVLRLPNRTRQYRLEVSDIDGFNPRAMLVSNQPIMSPSWSPNGKYIAYVSFESGTPAIYAQDVATGQRHIVTHAPGINGAPAWSPNGQQLAVVLTKSGNPNIYVVNVNNGAIVKRLTNDWSIDTEPRWAPDGKSILFTSNRGGGPQIYQLFLNTNKIQRLTFNGNYNASASFTPDGRNIVLLHRNRGAYNIAMQNLQTGRMTVLTQDGNCQSPSISPNGHMVLYATEFGGRNVLGIVSTDDKVQLRIPASGSSVREPAWGPF